MLGPGEILIWNTGKFCFGNVPNGLPYILTCNEGLSKVKVQRNFIMNNDSIISAC